MKLPHSPLPMLRLVPPLSLNRDQFVFPMRVHCSVPRCRWSLPALDADDACEQLAEHRMLAHGEGSRS